MRISFVGKGGSGKTTISALFARRLAEKKIPVLTIDADINQHLAQALGMPDAETTKIPPLGLEINRIKEYLRGTNPRISSIATMIKTTPPGTGSRLMRHKEQNPIFKHFERNVNGIRIMAVGPFGEEDLGVKCYHSKTGAVELILNHLIDAENEYLVVDMTAGADSFASGMFTKFDTAFLVVEPTLKSLGVYEQYKNYAKDRGIVIKVVGNKVENREDELFIKNRVGDDLVAVFSKSQYVKAIEKGGFLPLSELEQANKDALDLLIQEAASRKKDWRKFYENAVHFHIINARTWANAQVGEDLTLQVDPNFSFIDEVKKYLS